MSDNEIHHVSDTANWVAHYRAVETERKDALFHDPFARELAGERGEKIAKSMGATGKYTAWTLAIRTRIIDEMIEKVISSGVNAVLNLGAGLDSRPYRMRLPANLHWIEVDHPHLIEEKEKIMAKHTPLCKLERVKLDLSLGEQRRAFLKAVSEKHPKIVVLTEGVVPYLTEDQVAELARDLRAQSSIKFWIGEYYSERTLQFLRDPRRLKKMRNAPFRFFPNDWFGFFKAQGWSAREIVYSGEESLKHGRAIPSPWWTFVFRILQSKKLLEIQKRMTGYVLFEPT